MGSGVKAWNVHYFPTGSRAYKSIAPRPDVSIATYSRLTANLQFKSLTHLTQRSQTFDCFVLLKTSDTCLTVSLYKRSHYKNTEWHFMVKNVLKQLR